MSIGFFLLLEFMKLKKRLARHNYLKNEEVLWFDLKNFPPTISKTELHGGFLGIFNLEIFPILNIHIELWMIFYFNKNSKFDFRNFNNHNYCWNVKCQNWKVWKHFYWLYSDLCKDPPTEDDRIKKEFYRKRG